MCEVAAPSRSLRHRELLGGLRTPRGEQSLAGRPRAALALGVGASRAGAPELFPADRGGHGFLG